MNTIRGLIKHAAITVPAATLVGYLMAFFYEYGYFYAFKVPVSLISLNLTNIIIALSIVFCITGLVYTIIPHALYIDLLSMKSVKALVYINAAVWGYAVMITIVSQGSKLAVPPILCATLMSLLYFVYPLSLYRTKGYANKVELAILSQSKLPGYKAIDNAPAWYLSSIFYCIVGMAYIYLALSAGAGMANSKSLFFQPTGQPNFVAIEVTDQRIILKRIEPKTQRLNDGFKIITPQGVELHTIRLNHGICPVNYCSPILQELGS